MKRYLIIPTIIAACCLCGLSSCDKWLEATSSSQISKDKLFSSRNGFHEALTGVYLDMGSASCYGENCTWYANEITALNYTTDNSSSLVALQKHYYGSTVAMDIFTQIWKSCYNVIANANAILEELDKRRDVITSDYEYNLIRGELLGIRAYVHFDLLRMYGLGRWDNGNEGKMTVPYVTGYSKDVTPQLSYSETVKLLEKDVAEALELLADDPVTGNAPENFESTMNADRYWSYRSRHMNYYAVKALSARINMWKRDFDKAEEDAAEVIDHAFATGLVSWVNADAMVKEISNDLIDWTFSSEHVFSLEITSLYTYVSQFWYSSNPSVNVSLKTEEALFSQADENFEEDIRGRALLLKYNASGYTSYKFYGSTSFASEYRNRMPMIRISEMYLILAECHCRKAEYEEAFDCLDEIRAHRGYTDPIDRNLHPEPEYLLEFLRETLGEGQSCFMLKRLLAEGNEAAAGCGAMLEDFAGNTMYPYPTDETTYGRVQEK